MINANEIIVKADQTPGNASFTNFDELKRYLENSLSIYKTTVYSAENIQ